MTTVTQRHVYPFGSTGLEREREASPIPILIRFLFFHATRWLFYSLRGNELLDQFLSLWRIRRLLCHRPTLHCIHLALAQSSRAFRLTTVRASAWFKSGMAIPSNFPRRTG